MATTVTNSDIDTLASAVPAPYGPLTRVDDVPDTGPNSHMRIKFTSNVNTTEVYMSHDELDDDDTRDRILEIAHSGRGNNHAAYELALLAEVLNAYAASYSGPPFTDAEAQALVDMVRCSRMVVSQPPNISDDPADHVEADFTIVDAGSQVGTVTNTSTGDFDYQLWYWNYGVDDTDVTVGAVTSHDFTSADDYDVRLVVIGPGGIDTVTKTVTIA